MKNDDLEGQIFLPHPTTNNGLFFLLTLKYYMFIFKERLPEVPEYAGMEHITLMSLNITVTSLLF